MGFLAALGGIAAGTLIAFLCGVILDYLQVRNVLPESFTAWMMLPYTSAFAGLVAALVSVSFFGRYLRNRAGTGTASKTSGKTANVPKGMEHVPGMPMFDVESIRKGSSSTVSTVTRTPEQKQ
jgi:hypothetical protein